LKENGNVVFKHILGPENEAGIFTKNAEAGSLHRHPTGRLVGMLKGEHLQRARVSEIKQQLRLLRISLIF
jgi:hypothetical protein